MQAEKINNKLFLTAKMADKKTYNQRKWKTVCATYSFEDRPHKRKKAYTHGMEVPELVMMALLVLAEQCA